MATRRVNVLVYSGSGSTVESVRHCLYTLRQLLAPNYAVIPVTGDMLLKEPWTSTCAALVFPGGADLGYCRVLNGEGNRRIRQFVERGGAYIGFCAGAYYGSKKCEFEVGNKTLEVVGNRELAFFPGIHRGCAFPGFAYNSEAGARAVELKVDKRILSTGSVPNSFKSYYNGGGVFVDAPKYNEEGVEVLASYTEKLAVDSGEGAAAIIYCKVGQGHVLLSGPHPEFVFLGKPADNWSQTKSRFSIANPDKKQEVPGFSEVVDVLAGDEKHRTDFLKACLTKLGLQVSEEQKVPPLSFIHLSSTKPSQISELLLSLKEFITTEEGEEYLKDENDTFRIIKASTWGMRDLTKALTSASKEEKANASVDSSSTSDIITDYNTFTKDLIIHLNAPPTSIETPYFNHDAFFSAINGPNSGPATHRFGTTLFYGQTVTSTNTLLEKNSHMLRRLPHGTTFTATTQLAGRGRGSNVWVSPPGSLLFSTVIFHPMSAMSSAPVVFVQYLAAMAVVQGVKSYDGKLYEDMPIKLKWPNDIYMLSPGKENARDDRENYNKIGGILVNSHYNAKDYIAVVGIGLNVANAAPTTSLNALLPTLASSKVNSSELAPFELEKLLARILTCFEDLYVRFLQRGFDIFLQDLYYRDWLHMGQVVTLDTEGGATARITGITNDYGLLVAEEVERMADGTFKGTGQRWQLQSDSNSFDFFRGLIKRKI